MMCILKRQGLLYSVPETLAKGCLAVIHDCCTAASQFCSCIDFDSVICVIHDCKEQSQENDSFENDEDVEESMGKYVVKQ